MIDQVLRDQIEYYRARAGEYDEWFYRKGRFDRGPEANALWFAEAEVVARALDSFKPTGKVLELACGTGIWTERLLAHADSLTAVDASPEVLAINRERVGDARVRRIQANVFEWKPDDAYDVVFFSFWLSHVPSERFASFWSIVRSALAPNGRVFFIDSRPDPRSTSADHMLPGEDTELMTRRLNDGREFKIVKIFYEPDRLTAALDDLGWCADVRATEHFFLYGSAAPASQ